MSLQDILKEILSQAESKVQEINVNLDKEKATMKKASEKTLNEALEQVKAKGEEASASVKTKTEELARKENRKTRLKSRRMIVENALSALEKHLATISDADYESFFKKSTAQLGNVKGTFLVPEKRSTLVKKLCPDGCEVKADKSVESGFRFQSPDFLIDSTFNNLVMSEYRSELEMYFTQQLNLDS